MSSKIKDRMLGKEIVSFDMPDDGSSITFHFKDSVPLKLDTYGDCCSYTWIESLDAPDALIGVVQDVEELDMPDLGNVDGARHAGVDQVSYYGLKITTNKGRCVIDYRNDSNGYYGGSLEVSD